MPEKNEKMPMEQTFIQKNGLDKHTLPMDMEMSSTVKLQVVQPGELKHITETPVPLPAPYTKRVPVTMLTGKVSQQEAAAAHLVLEQCRHLCLSLFFRELHPVRSLGFSSSIGGEGKSFLALATAQVLAQDSIEPVTLIECNWEHPTLHDFFGIPATPGWAEWLRGTCHESEIRYQVNENLTVIPAGNGKLDATKLLKKVQRHGLTKMFGHANELFIVDLPSVMTSGYSLLAASLAEVAVLVVRSEAIPMTTLTEICTQLKEHTSLYGIILNQEQSAIPRWMQQLL